MGGPMPKILSAVIAVLSMLSAPIAANAIAVIPTTSSFAWTGFCTDDCIGTASGVLTLDGYTQGNALATSNFVKFEYTSDFLGTVTVDSISDIFGNIPATLPGAANVDFHSSDGGVHFTSTLNGTWFLSNSVVPLDAGISGTFSATPLPAALPLFATGLGALGVLGWRRKRKAKTA